MKKIDEILNLNQIYEILTIFVNKVYLKMLVKTTLVSLNNFIW